MDETLRTSLLALAFASAAILPVLVARTRRARAHALGAVVVVVVAGCTVFTCLRLRVNLSESVPLGLYQTDLALTQRLHRGSLVVLCSPASAVHLALERGYLAYGSCTDKTMPLLKVVAAEEGDEVRLSRIGFTVNGCLIPDSAPRELDRSGRPLHHWPFLTAIVPRGVLWVYGVNPLSWDSRYWGPISSTAIVSVARPLVASGEVRMCSRQRLRAP